MLRLLLGSKKKVLLSESLNSFPNGWNIGGWEYGKPSCGPTSGHTGKYVIGYNLSGNYSADMPGILTSSPRINCTGSKKKVELSFWRWLQVEENSFDNASVEVSNNNGASWHTVWANPDTDIIDISWKRMSYDISKWAAGQPSVHIRWIMGPTDDSIQFCGWNIDDIEVTGY